MFDEATGAVHEGVLEMTFDARRSARLTSVRLRCDRDVELRDEPFDLRERLLQHFAVAFGRRRRDDGSVDLWAEVARRR